jgi:SAM-dependent methyltransferase
MSLMPAPLVAASRPRVHAHPAGSGRAALVLRAHTGEALDLNPPRWHGAASAEEQALLADVAGPVIDLGCGPGRLLVTLTRRGVRALGVDSSASAVALARARGAPVLQRDVFAPLPQEGRWATALLFDGTVGIGGEPVRLLRRCRRLLATGGEILAEVAPPGTGWRRVTAWFERDGQRQSPAFAWAVVGADAADELAGASGLTVRSVTRTASDRWFARFQAAGFPG